MNTILNECNVELLSPGKPRPLSMPVDTCLGVVDPYAKPWTQGRKGIDKHAFTLMQNHYNSIEMKIPCIPPKRITF